MRSRTHLLSSACALFLIGPTAQAQFTTEWITLFDGLSGYHSAEDLALLPDGGVAVSGIFTYDNTVTFHAAAFDASGALLWTNGLPDSIGRAWKLIELNDGSLLALGDYENLTGTNDVLVHRYSTGGALLIEVVINSPGLNTGDDFGDATMDAQGNVYITGTFASGGQAKPGLARLSPTGTLDWWVTHPLSVGWNGFAKGLALEVLGDSVAVVWTRNGSSFSAAIAYDAGGTHLWTTDLPVSATDNNNAMTTDGLGHVLVGGGRNQQFNVTKLDAAGSVLWSTDFAFPGLSSGSGRIRHVRCDAQGDVYAVGEGPFQASIPGPYLLAAKLSSAGNVLWTDTLTGGSINQCLNMDHALVHEDRWIIATSYVGSYLYAFDTSGTRLFRQAWNVSGAQSSKVNAMAMDEAGVLYLAGRAQLPGAAGDGFVAKLNAAPTGQGEALAPDAMLYPIPAMDQLYLPAWSAAGVHVSVRDIQGRSVLRTWAQGALDVAVLPPGIYTIEVAGRSGRWRFVKG